MTIRWIAVLYLVAVVATGSAQPLTYFRNLTVADGLAANQIHSFLQDRQGLMWIGTTDGLQRYDGLSFANFLHDPEKPESIGSNSITWNLAEDHLGRIWVPHGKAGVSRFDPRTASFTNFSFENGKLPSEGANAVDAVLAGPHGDVYFATYHGLLMVDSQDRVHDLAALQGAPHVGLRNMFLYKDRWLWMTSANGLYCFDVERRRWGYNGSAGPRCPGYQVHGSTLFGGAIWFGIHAARGQGKRYLYNFDIETGDFDSVAIAPELKRHDYFTDQLHSITHDRQGLLWTGTEQLGLLSYDHRTGEWKQFAHGSEWSGSLLEGIIWDVYEDRAGNLWIGSESGVSILARSRPHFENYVTVPDAHGEVHALETYESRACVAPNGDVWLAELGLGLTRLSEDMTVLDHRLPVTGARGTTPRHAQPLWADEHALIAHVWGDGLFGIDRRTGRTVRYLDGPAGKPELQNILRARDGAYWAWGRGRFGRLDLQTGAYDFIGMPLNRQGQPDVAWDAIEDDSGRLWLGTFNSGLLCVDPQHMKIVKEVNAHTGEPLKSAWTLVYSRGRIYFAYDGSGMGVLDIATLSVERFTKKDGLCTDDISGFVLDSDGDVWIYGPSGVSWFDRERNRFRTFRSGDGMISEQVYHAVLMRNGRILLVNAKGLTTFNPAQLKASSESRKPSLRSLRVFDTEVDLHDWITDLSTVRVAWNHNYLRAEFSALEFFDPDKVKFAYKLEGAEPDWNYTDYHPVAIYTGLKGGHYDLVVKCTNMDGEWGPELRIPVFVTTPFFRQAWFYAILVVIAVGIVSLIYRYQLNRKLAIERVRNRLARDLHDDIGSTLSAISIYSNVAQKAFDHDSVEGHKLLTRIGTNAREMMESMDDIVWAIDPAHDELEHVIARMRAYALPILEAQNIQLNLRVDAHAKSLKLDMVKRKNLFLIFKEAVNNMAKYSQATTAEVSIRKESGTLTMTVSDNGQGFDPAQRSDRHGLKNMEARAAEARGSWTIRSVPGHGTQVTFVMTI